MKVFVNRQHDMLIQEKKEDSGRVIVWVQWEWRASYPFLLPQSLIRYTYLINISY